MLKKQRLAAVKLKGYNYRKLFKTSPELSFSKTMGLNYNYNSLEQSISLRP